MSQPTAPGRGPLRVVRRRRGRPDEVSQLEVQGPAEDQRVAVVIPAKDESQRIAATVRAARAIPHVDLVLVVDDGSEDDTQHVARAAGAVVVRHSHNRGKASAMETGAAVVAMRDVEGGPPRLLLFIDADLGETAVNTAPLVPPVLAGRADLSVAVLPRQPGAGGRGIVTGLARRAIQRASGWSPKQPLSGQRCLTREAFEAATPLARGWGVETGMTLDLLAQGFRIVEVPCDLRHRPSGNDLAGQMHRAAQYRDIAYAIGMRRMRTFGRRPPASEVRPALPGSTPDPVDAGDVEGTTAPGGSGARPADGPDRASGDASGQTPSDAPGDVRKDQAEES
ncbi:glycosyl transferase family 2 [Beutenbergia cavernae DSM 12333]|uniref:Glucosyl-3-phosphoglycerate synthase n=1 Tax=Beutenbergia cavernae (strain ATCC BAA-8 / DSM 12333 / CCUG 43141 / JCM 11478 / NBRC 16432 / NCIMB 13614 / HKI 0122) TaxID=471853 RepID=C5BWI1_BEUC1|nr:glycosyl transferase family 2 [Beutenbergia cavernae DSM 12333]